ncbi:S49 family peptidase [Rhizobium rhizogenes]|uniref:S49 family peptidase n=1 Tax=Rhizobium rhizogenes TaxID=359 RepID=UPI003ED027E8
MHNALLATFHNQPALLAAGMQSQFEAFLHEANALSNRIQAANDNPVMADDFWPAPDSWMTQYRPYIIKSGILLIPVKGVLLHDYGYQLGSYATGYVYLAKALERGLADPEVKGIAWIHDSPGGHVAGNFDLGDKIFAARGVKPMRAFAAENSYSASYSLASAAGPITVSRTGGVGSIGVVTVHVDVSKAMDSEGVKVTLIHFGKHKVDGNSYEALPKEVKDRIQGRIDDLGGIFVSKTARNRGMDAQIIRNFEALTFTATEATSNGLADSIGSLDDAIAVFAADLSLEDEDTEMSTMKTTISAQTAYDAAYAESFAGGKAQGKTEGLKEGAIAFRNRVRAIVDSDEGKARPAAARAAALSTDMTVEQATSFIATLPLETEASRADRAFALAGKRKSNVVDFHTTMNASKHPQVGAAMDDGNQPQGSRADRAFALAGATKNKPIHPH